MWVMAGARAYVQMPSRHMCGMRSSIADAETGSFKIVGVDVAYATISD